MLPTISQVCTLPAAVEQELDDYAAAQCGAVELWLTKVEDYLQGGPAERLLQRLQSLQLRPVSAAYQGGLLASQGARREEAWKLLDRRLQLCRQLGVETLVVACDVPAPIDAQGLQRVQVSLADLAGRAAQAGVRVALEFQAAAAVGNNLQTAAALVAEVGQPSLGLCLDVFHFHVGPSKHDDLGLLTAENLFLVQLCDLADVPREFASDSDRILPGDGEIALGPLRQRLQDIQYAGPVTVETLNPQLWQVPSLQFSEIAITAVRKWLQAA